MIVEEDSRITTLGSKENKMATKYNHLMKNTFHIFHINKVFLLVCPFDEELPSTFFQLNKYLFYEDLKLSTTRRQIQELDQQILCQQGKLDPLSSSAGIQFGKILKRDSFSRLELCIVCFDILLCQKFILFFHY